jgi:hypothetical protein
MSEQTFPRFMTVPVTLEFIRELYGISMSRPTLYRRAYQGCFKLFEEPLPERAKIMFETKDIIEYYEQKMGITPLETAA